ncbi:MAG: 3-phosphoshikimate 1-carboxyvinyltransferase [Caldisericia bacterium]|nr:3-phosphoshikimate 1-carboxyvinyltransferase [Caldisericia bacterium]
MVEIKPIKRVKGEIKISGDKSITHRAYIFSSISKGESFIKNPNKGEDTQRTLEIMRKVGAEIFIEEKGVRIKGIGFNGIKEPEDILFAGNSGTTIRLLAGLFSSIENKLFIITGDESLRNRPMRRVIEPISKMGGLILGRESGNYPPLAIFGKRLSGIEYELKKPSAQVKSAIILATLNAREKSIIIEKIKTRDHTEIMLKEFGGKIEVCEDKIIVYPIENLIGREIFVPGDFSSASYFILLSLLLPDSEILIKDISLNPTRVYLLNKLIENGGDIKILNEKILNGEKFGDLLVKTSLIKKIEIKREEAPLLIDELPLIGAIGAFLDEGVEVHGAEELRVKESDRIKVLVDNLKNLGVKAEELPDGFRVEKSKFIKKGVIKTANDHRIVLSFSVFGLLSKEGVILEEIESIKISFPDFFNLLKEVSYV